MSSTFGSDFASHHFSALAEPLGATATYTPPTGSAVSTTVLLGERTTQVVTRAEGEYIREEMAAWVKVADVASVTVDKDSVTISSATWTVIGAAEELNGVRRVDLARETRRSVGRGHRWE